jgi:hypothetical protein
MKIPNRIIRNIDFPSCKNCVYYLPSGLNNDFASSLNKCKNFGAKDVVTGEITYDYATTCRYNENLCGNSGKYYVKEPRIVLKRLKHTIFRPVTILYAVAGLYLVLFYGMWVVK